LRKKIYSILLILILLPGVLTAGGFQINEHGAKAMAMGGAFTAIANDASAIYWNGAGMTQLSGTNFLLGTALIAPSTSFRGVSPSVDISYMKSATFFPSHLFVTHSITNSLSAGIGITTPFGLGTEWNENWVGKYLAIETELKTFWVPVTVAYKVLDNLSVSGSFVYSFADVLITRKNSQAPFEGDAFVELEGDDASSFGYTFGLMYKPIEQLSIGASFRSELNYTFEGTATTTGAQQLMEENQLPNGDVTAELTTPMNIVGGIAVDVIPQLKLSADFQWVGWSSYDQLAVDFADPEYEDLASPREYEDTYVIRFGAQYRMSEQLALLGGIYFDKMPVKPERVNPTLPDSDRLGFSIGADAKIMEGFGLSASYLFIRVSELTVDNSKEIYTMGNTPFNGTYNSYANLLSLSLYYNLQ
jgi:long-chain fatty acid transport protein